MSQKDLILEMLKSAPRRIKEIWKPMPEFNNYFISNYGRVRRFEQYIRCKNKDGFLKPIPSKESGYLAVTIHQNDKAFCKRVHVYVALAFFGKRRKGYEVNHKDGNKNNNCAWNLEYVTPKQNMAHSVRLGLTAWGERNCKSKLSEKHIKEIKNSYKNGERSLTLAKKYKVHQSSILRILRGETWKRIPDQRIFA